MNLNPRVRCAFGNVVIHLDLLLLLRTYAHKQLSRNWLKLAENKNKPTLKIIIIKLIKIHSTHRVHCGYLDLLNYNRCCWFVKEKIQGVSSTGPPLKINKRQSTCKSHQKSSQCQNFLRVKQPSRIQLLFHWHVLKCAFLLPDCKKYSW